MTVIKIIIQIITHNNIKILKINKTTHKMKITIGGIMISLNKKIIKKLITVQTLNNFKEMKTELIYFMQILKTLLIK